MKKLYLLLFLLFPLFAISAPLAPFGLEWEMDKNDVIRLYSGSEIEKGSDWVIVKKLPDGNDLVSIYTLKFENNKLVGITALINVLELEKEKYSIIADKIIRKIYFGYDFFLPENIESEIYSFNEELTKNRSAILQLLSDDLEVTVNIDLKQVRPHFTVEYKLSDEYKERVINNTEVKGF